MFLMDEDYEPFDPFNIGPKESKAYNYTAPETPSYPPPVQATWPKPKQHTNRSVSQATLNKSSVDVLYKKRSELGKVSVSQAINKEMSASKNEIPDGLPYHIGGKPKSSRASVRSKNRSIDHHKSESKHSSSHTSKREHAGAHASYVSASQRSQQTQSSFQPELTSSARSRSTIKGSRTSHTLNRVTPSLKNVADSIQKDLRETLRISKTLFTKAAELSKRLKANYD